MRILIAPNSFKNCLSARHVAEALARGARSACPDLKVDIIPLADGGDGLISVLASTLGGGVIASDAQDALGRPIKASWLKTENYAVIEMALASGLARLQGPSEYDPMKASTFGTGMLINAALEQGCRNLIIGLGGSATVDAGCGMALALGFRLEDAQGDLIPSGGAGLLKLARIELPKNHKIFLRKVKVTALVDVDNPLLGSLGAANVFAPQKGATPEEIVLLERGLASWASIVKRDLGVSVSMISGAGAAGGLGAGCAAFFGAFLEPGAKWIAMQSGLPAAISRADLVFTGEGRIDSQTQFGKVPACVAKMARVCGKPVIGFGGYVEKGVDLTHVGLNRCIQISPDDISLEEAIQSASENLEKTAARVMKLLRC